MKEIGSEYWIEAAASQASRETLLDLTSFGSDRRYLFAGRTAIDFVLSDLKFINTVYMPSYCCNSMLQPFIEREIEVLFYDVTFEEGSLRYKIDFECNTDVFFAMSYFGFEQTNMDSIINFFKDKNVTVIEDITHRLLSEKNHSRKADYIIASLRKWVPIPSGGLAVKQNGHFATSELAAPSSELINKKMTAMKKKEQYMRNDEIEKVDYKSLKIEFMMYYSEFNERIGYEYQGVRIDDYSEQYLKKVDIAQVKNQRRKNAKEIYRALKKSKNVDFLLKQPNFSVDCPLFVPIIVRSDERGILRERLVEASVYCPIHWPTPQEVERQNKISNLYDIELSLICDQRYDSDDMQKIIEVIGEF